MNTKNLLVVLFGTVLMLNMILFLYTPLIRADNTIPKPYDEELNINDTLVYNVTQFDEPLNWWDLDWTDQGWVNSTKGGQIIVNFTGFYAKHPNDYSPLPNPTPYINVSFIANISNKLILNRTLSNISSYEAANQLAIGYNEFDPGFLIPTQDLDKLAQDALAQDQSGFWEAEIEVIEYIKTIKFVFHKSDNSQNTTVIYDKETGVLVWAKVESLYGPDVEFFLVDYDLSTIGFNTDYSRELDYGETLIYNVTQFDEPLNWYNLDWNDQGWVNSTKGGQIVVNFTGFYKKHSNDYSPFSNPTPYINISFIANISNNLILNRTFSNISSYEAANQLAIGYNEFDPGFLIPNKDLDKLTQDASAQDQSGFWEAEVEVEEYIKTIKFGFVKSDNSQNTTVIYDKETGVLVWAKVESLYGPDVEFFLLNYNISMVRFNTDYSRDIDYDQTLVYNVTQFDEPLNWWDLDWTDQGWVNSTKGGKILVNFTGFYAKHPNDNSPFRNPTPYINISFIANISNNLILNRTLTNLSSYEAANQLAIGYNEFDPGFLSPINDFDALFQNAFAQNESGFWEASIYVIEYEEAFEIRFFKTDNTQNTTITYDKKTGILMKAVVESLYGPDLEIELDTKKKPLTAKDDIYDENDVATQAYAIGEGVYKNLLCADDDWYKLELKKNAELDISISFIHAQGDINLRLYDSSNNLVESSITSENNENVVYNVTSNSGTYYFLINGTLNMMNPYNLRIEITEADVDNEEEDEVEEEPLTLEIPAYSLWVLGLTSIAVIGVIIRKIRLHK